MIRNLLILSAIALAVLAALYFTRTGEHPRITDGPAPPAPAAEQAAKPAAAKAPEPKAAASPPTEPAPVQDQIAEDAAAVGMTTREPAPDQGPAETPTEKK